MKKMLFAAVASLFAFGASASQKCIGLPGPELGITQPFGGVVSINNTNPPDLQYYYDNGGEADPRDVYSMGYGGSDMWGGTEGYTFVYLQDGHSSFSISGELEICMDAENMNCGIMVRNQPGAGGYCLCFNYRKNGSGDRFWNVNGRDNDWDGIRNIILGPDNLRGDDNRCWLKLERDGNVFNFYYRESSSDGWSLFGSYTDSNNLFNESVYAGIYMCAGSGPGWANFRGIEYDYTASAFEPPTNVNATKGTGAAQVTWTGTANAVAYRIERLADGDSEWTALATESAAETSFSYTDSTALRDGTQYSFRVVALGGNGESAASSAVVAKYFDWGDGTGLLAAYYDTTGGTNRLVATRLEGPLNFPWNYDGPAAGLADNFRAVYRGKLIIPFTSTYKFFWEVDDTLVVLVDGVPMSNNADVNMTRGEHDILVTFEERTDLAYFHLSWEEAMYIPRLATPPYNNPIPLSQFKPAASMPDVADAGWAGWCAVGGESWNTSRASVDYNPSTGVYDVRYGTIDMWDASEGYVYVWRATQGDFDLCARVDNLSWATNHKAGLMVRRSPAAGECDLAFNHRLADSGQFYFVDVNGRQSVGYGISDHKAGLPAEDYPVGQSVYMKIAKRGTGYVFSYRNPEENAWTEFDTFDDTAKLFGERPVVGLACFECGQFGLQLARFSEVAYVERSPGMVVIVK